MADSMHGPTREMVQNAIREFRDANPSKHEATLEDVIQVLAPIAAAQVQAGQDAGILWAESVSNILKELGRDGDFVVVLVPDERGYENPVVRF